MNRQHLTSGRGYRGQGSWRYAAASSSPRKPSTEAPPLGDIMNSLQISELDIAASESKSPSSIIDCTYAGSYNWLDLSNPTIVTPGLPPTWTPPKLAAQLQEDAGEYYRDINAAKYPFHPMEPAVKSIIASEDTIQYTDIDIFGCGSTFGNLMRFARQENKAFRMVVEAVGTTVFLVRRENSPRETIQDIRGYGHSMPEAYTTWQKDVKGSATHQRVIQYMFGGLKCLVRFEADGYLPDLCGDAPETPAKGGSTSKTASGDEDLAGILKDSVIVPKTPNNAPLSTRSAGWVVPQSSLFDLKTRSRKRQGEDFLAEQLPRLWITQVPNFVLGFHERGKFTEVQVKNVKTEVQNWASKNRASLDRFSAVLHKVLSFAREGSDSRFELLYAGVGDLELRGVGGDVGACISPELKNQWLRA